MRNEIATAADAVIDNPCTSGFVGVGVPTSYCSRWRSAFTKRASHAISRSSRDRTLRVPLDGGRPRERDCYGAVSRYTTGAFMRLKLAQAHYPRSAAHIFDSLQDAQAFHSQVQAQLNARSCTSAIPRGYQ